jgi:phosphopantothenoylcysteine decarboxylase/phosphopantothenate--cysteine ligase
MNPFVKDNLEPILAGKKVLLGITGSIAAFKACDVVRFLRACGASVRVVLTQGAENFVTKTTLETLSGNPVLSGFWEISENANSQGTHHIDTARWADLILVAPASAHFIGKMANGLADDLLSTELLAFQGPVAIAPAMNPAMYSHPAVQDNIQKLVSRGVRILGPSRGVTSCGEEGLGRMIEPETIVEEVSRSFSHPPLRRKVVITLGPTRSALDPVRYITNRSSGLMGAALCWAASQEGYDVTAICGPTEAPLPGDIRTIRVQTASEMYRASLEEWNTAQVFIASAAVLDWEFPQASSVKLKKEQGAPQLRLERTPDILAEVCRLKKPDQYVLGFAAETDHHISNGIDKLQRKGCDAIFVNDVSANDSGFEVATNAGWWVTLPDVAIPIENCKKTILARKLIHFISQKVGHS